MRFKYLFLGFMLLILAGSMTAIAAADDYESVGDYTFDIPDGYQVGRKEENPMDATTAVSALSTAMSAAATQIESVIGNAINVALPVAGTVLAITIGWRLFRNFTRG